MGHDYAIDVDGTALSSICANALMLEGSAGGRVEVHEFAYQDGGQVQSFDWVTKPRLTMLRTVLNPGTPAAIYQSLHDLSGLLLGGEKLLTRTDPFAGIVEAEVAVIDGTRQKEGAQRIEWDWPMWILPGHFRDATDTLDSASGLGTSATIGNYTPGGTHPTAPVITLTCTVAGTNPVLAMTTGGQESFGISGAYDPGDEIAIDVPARTVFLNGTRVKNLSNPSHSHWIRWAEGVVNTLTFTADTGDWDADIAFADRWRV